MNALLAKNREEQQRQVAASRDDQSEWEAAVRSEFTWRPLIPTNAFSHHGQSCDIQSDHSIRVSGETTPAERYEVQGGFDLNQATALRLEAIPESAGSSPLGSEGFVLSRIRVLPGEAISPKGVRFVRVEIPNRHQYLKMAEVQVHHGEENVALAGVASQSSSAYEGFAQLAIDGRTDPDFAGGRSTAHTAFDRAPWWEVDLGKASPVDRISLWASAENQHRLVGAQVALLDASRYPLWSERLRFAPDMSATFYPSPTPYPQLVLAGADSQRAEYPAMHAIENRDAQRHGWSPDPQQGASSSLVVGFERPWQSEGPIRWRILLEQHDGQDSRGKLRHFRISATADPRAAQAAAVSSETREIAQISSDRRTPEQATKITEYYQSINPTLQALVAEQEDIERRMTDELRVDKTPIMQELPPDQQRKTHVHIRGSFLDLGEAVEPGTPTIFHKFPANAPRNRLGLARWLVDRQNPLTARVAANRQWEQLFGIGLVRTSEDFGSQGTLPANAPLLDWLAMELMDHGWSLKHLTKTIVTSATYCQSARITPDKLSRDPENLLNSRGPSIRLSAEQIRDQALFSSGLLSRKMYGPSVMPYQPEGVWQVVYSDDRWKLSSGEDRFRRGLYTYWRRTSPYPSAMSLDATSRETCAIRRITTNTPVAALALLNDPAAVEAARALARKVVTHEPSDTASKAYFAFRSVLLRPPTDSERQRIERLFTDQRERYEHDLKAAAALTVGDDEPASRRDLPALAAWTVVGNVLLNLDETVTK